MSSLRSYHSYTSLFAIIHSHVSDVPHHDQPQHYHALRKVPQRNFSPPAHCDPHVAALVAILASPVIILQRSVRSRTHTTLRVKLSDSRTRCVCNLLTRVEINF